MTEDPLKQNLDITGSSIHNSQIGQSRRDLIQSHSTVHNNEGNVTHYLGNVVNNVVNTIFPPFETIKGALINTSNWVRSMLPEPKYYYYNIAQFDANYLMKMEQIEQERLKLETIDFTHRADTAKKLIQLQNEELQLQNERFLWEKSVVEKNLRLIQESQVNALEERRKELQIQSDMQYLRLQATRGDIVELLSQESGKFVIIPSPPEILSEVQAFQSLKVEIPHNLQDTINKYYSSETTKPCIGYRNIFDEYINDTQASVVGTFLLPIPTLIFHSKVAHQYVYMSITLTSPEFTQIENKFLINYKPNICNIPLPRWNWAEVNKELQLQGLAPGESYQKILDLITTIHTVVAIYFSDLYCLNLNPYHNLKLFQFIDDSKFSEALQTWVEPFQNYLLEAQSKIQEELKNIRQLQIEQTRQYYSGSNYINFAQVIGCIIGIMFLFAMCNQQSSQVNTVDTGEQHFVENQQDKSGVIQVPYPDIDTANLRIAPNEESKVVGILKNGTIVNLLEVTSDGQWQKVTTQDGMSGWVWAKFVQ